MLNGFGLRHAAIISRDLRRSLDFYCGVLGFEAYHVTDPDWAMVSLSGTTLSFLRVPASTPVLSPSKSPAFHPSHLGFTVQSPSAVDLAREKLLENGHAPAPASRHRDGSYGFYCSDPDGNQLEIIFIPAVPETDSQKPVSGRMPTPRGVLLLAHGSIDPVWRAPFEDLLALFRLNASGFRVELGYMEFAQPTFMEVAEAMAADCPEITVVPLFMSSGGHVAYDIPVLVERARRTFPKTRWFQQSALGEDPIVQEALIQASIARIKRPRASSSKS